MATPVPEPSTGLLLAFGLVGLAVGRRRRVLQRVASLGDPQRGTVTLARDPEQPESPGS